MYDHEGRRRVVAARPHRSVETLGGQRRNESIEMSATEARELAREKARIGGRGLTERDGRKGWEDGLAWTI